MITYNKLTDPNKEFPEAKSVTKEPLYYLLRQAERLNSLLPDVYLTAELNATLDFKQAGLFTGKQLSETPECLHDKFLVVPEYKIVAEKELVLSTEQ